MSVRIFFIFFGIFCWIAVFSSYWFLIYVHKTRYRNLWEKEKKKDSFWIPYGSTLLRGFEWETPYWIKQERDAFLVVWIYRFSLLGFMLSVIALFFFPTK